MAEPRIAPGLFRHRRLWQRQHPAAADRRCHAPGIRAPPRRGRSGAVRAHRRRQPLCRREPRLPDRGLGQSGPPLGNQILPALPRPAARDSVSPSLGNHDGNVSENRDDLTTYLDNFFFPDNRPARWYTFSYANLAQFVALDSTENTIAGPPSPVFAPGGEQSKWLARVLAESHAPWKIPYFHHPPFNAGPGHGAALGTLRHWVDLFRNNGVRAVFSGHEHNFQFSEDSDATGHVRYFVTGSGGQLRPGDVRPNMRSAHIEGWSPQYEFLVVEIEGGAMHVTPLGNVPVVVRDADGKPIPMPAAIQLPQ
jgi:hypothetical protein